MSWLNLTYEQAESINRTIDKYHDPYYWTFGAIVASFFLLESFLPRRDHFESRFDRYYTHFKLSLIIFFTSIAISQGILGGCFIQIPQNWIARHYLNRPYWYPYGVVFRENFPENQWWLLRLIYLVVGIGIVYLAYKFWTKRVKNVKLKK